MRYEKWSEFKKKIYSEAEITEADEKADLICALVEARKEKGMSQRDLEEATGIKQPMIARIEKGQTYPRYDTLLKIFKALGKKLIITEAKKNPI